MTIRRIVSALFLSAGVLAAAAPILTAQAGPMSWLTGGERIQGSGKIIKQNREVSHFNALSVGVSGDVEIRLGSTEGLSIETDDNIQQAIETVVENGTLRIRTAKNNLKLDTRTMKIVVTARNLDKLSIGGSGTVTADKLRGEKLTIDVGGSGAINIGQMESESVAIALGGSGSLKASGTTERLQVSIGGSGRVQVGQLQARDAVVSIGGSGQATVWAQKSLNLSVAGSGDINYYGDPQISKSIMGSGTIKRLGGSPQ
ncbi:Putative auto-transporter adhesin, head GIN domain [Duganella sacchari]|uniref:Putative auto-transporter adhesin, head GIN domain n=1 Tax=Duganella sacchari TaxID=551987 RepID=A0A1M7QJV8_9BURK|nr:head GIN domain-containing protein [Duganella sacchari]SHN31511.1 Putative auto-transporter adhesin, head GIN domain [Duganella sacchari]